MTEGAPPPRFRTGALWAVLLLFMLGGTVASIYVVWGASQLLTGGSPLLDVPVMLAALVIGILCVLFVIGLLYRVDRLRGVPHREVALFE